MPSAWRIVRAARVNSAFTGEGARVYGGRWNSRGTAVIYVSEHESLAALELFVHLTPLSPNDRYRSFRLEWEDKLTEYFPVKSLPPHWNAEPPTFQTMQIGDDWVRRGISVALAVPSDAAVIDEPPFRDQGAQSTKLRLPRTLIGSSFRACMCSPVCWCR